jgi:outer membrane protein OmpA-like peptidoglycan-associated protein
MRMTDSTTGQTGWMTCRAGVATAILSLALAGCGSQLAESTSSTTAAPTTGAPPTTAEATTTAAPTTGAPTTAAPTTGAATGPGTSGPGTGSGASGPSSATGRDFDQDGTPDPTCGTADLGGSLVVKTLCSPLSPDLESGVTATDGSILRITGIGLAETENADVTVRQAETSDGRLATIFILGSDTLFDSGQSTIRSNAQAALPSVVAAINAHFAGSEVIVRGHADSTGDPDTNLRLSQERATAVADWLAGNGLSAPKPAAVGLGSTVPAALEDTEIGTTTNRRVEILVLQ